MCKLGSLNRNAKITFDHAGNSKQKLSVMLRPESWPFDTAKLRPRIPDTIIEIDEEPSSFSHSIDEQLHAYAVGNKLKRLRLRKGMALVTLGKLSSLSSSMLCKLERGRALPTLPTLLRLSRALGVDLEYFFRDPQRPSVSIVRRNERLRFRNVPDSSYSYAFENLNFRAKQKKFNAYWAEFQPVSKRIHSHQHKGAEFLYLLEGEMAIRIGPEEHHLQAGDAIYFESDAPHSYRRLSANPCRAIVVSSTDDDCEPSDDSSWPEHS